MPSLDTDVRFNLGDTEALWRSESDAPAPKLIGRVGDELDADTALRRVRKGEYLLHEGTFHNAKQLVAAMGRRLEKRQKKSQGDLPSTFRSERDLRAKEHDALSRIIVVIEPGYRVKLKQSPDVADLCKRAWGPSTLPTVISLKTLLGMLGADGWYRKGLEVPGLTGTVHPHYGVFLPTRSDYVDLVLKAPAPVGKTVFDIGTGTGVLGFLLLQREAKSALGTDIDPRSVSCANENAIRLGLGNRFEAQLIDGYPTGKADLIICNPPWIPEAPKNRLDRAVFDLDSRFLTAFIDGLKKHLNPGGEGWLLLSNLAEVMGLRSPTFVAEHVKAAGLTVKWSRQTGPAHPKAKDETDPMHAARTAELTTLYCLVPA